MELIDRLEVIKELEMSTVFFPEYKDGIKHAIDALNYAPTIDAQVVRHGQWKYGYCAEAGMRCYFCTACGKEAYWDTDYGQQLFDFCQNCGAQMDGGVEND